MTRISVLESDKTNKHTSEPRFGSRAVGFAHALSVPDTHSRSHIIPEMAMPRRDSFEPIELLEQPSVHHHGAFALNQTASQAQEFLHNTGARVALLLQDHDWELYVCLACLLLMLASGYQLWSLRSSKPSAKAQ